MDLHLPPTFLRWVELSRSAVAVLQGRVYTLIENDPHLNGGNFYQYRGQQFSLEKAEEVVDMEQKLFESREQHILAYMRWVVDFKLTRRAEERGAQLEGLKKKLESAQDDSVERFIMVDLFNAYNRESRGSSSSNSDVNTEGLTALTDIKTNEPELSHLRATGSTLDELLGGKGILVKGGCCYKLNCARPAGRNGEFVHFNGSRMYPNGSCETQELERRYQQSLAARIESAALSQGIVYSRMLEEQRGAIQQLESGLASNGSYSNQQSGTRGQIGFRKLGSGKYGIFIEIPSFIMAVEGNYYAFGTARLGTTLKVQDQKVMVEESPRILNMPYFHPFVWPDSLVCYNGAGGWQGLGIKFKHWYDIGDKRTARTLALVFKQAKMIMEQGYISEDIHPVFDISQFTPIATSQSGAKQYARSHSIPYERIIEND